MVFRGAFANSRARIAGFPSRLTDSFRRASDEPRPRDRAIDFRHLARDVAPGIGQRGRHQRELAEQAEGVARGDRALSSPSRRTSVMGRVGSNTTPPVARAKPATTNARAFGACRIGLRLQVLRGGDRRAGKHAKQGDQNDRGEPVAHHARIIHFSARSPYFLPFFAVFFTAFAAFFGALSSARPSSPPSRPSWQLSSPVWRPS